MSIMYRTEQACVHWVRRFVLFSGKRHLETLGEAEVTRLVPEPPRRRPPGRSCNPGLSAFCPAFPPSGGAQVRSTLARWAHAAQEARSILWRVEIIRGGLREASPALSLAAVPSVSMLFGVAARSAEKTKGGRSRLRCESESRQTLKLSPQPQLAFTFGLLNRNAALSPSLP